ncbi:MAG: hypothetical protein GY807_10780, partial [Gammaproteobacteria bacterium]|nr:hypothetical protein [Gammaproteobacteria bacterium]
MKHLIARLRFSLSARLMLLFLLTGALLAITLRWGMGTALRHQFDQNIHPHIIQYLSYIQQDLGDPPDIEKAVILANQLPVDIVIQGPGVDWSSMSEQPDFSRHQFRALGQTSTQQLAIGRQGEYFILRSARETYQVYLLIHGRAGHVHGIWFGLLLLGIMLLILFLSYRGIR